jgi:hypothetical protein
MDRFSAHADARDDGALSVRRPLLLLCLVAVVLFAQGYQVFADGGIVQLQRSAGPFVITVFTAPAPLCAGPADVSIMIQERNSMHPVLDAEVIVILQRDGGETIEAAAKRVQSKNKLLYTALMLVPKAGRWEIEVMVLRKPEEIRIGGTMTVAPPRHFLPTHWWVLALPPVTIGLFVINQWLKRRLKSGWKM